MPDKIVYFAIISDTHIGPTADFSRHGYEPLPCARRVVEIINNLPTKPDFVIHTGDIVTDPDPISYQLAAEVLSKIEAPIYFVNGNHDTAQDIHKYFVMGPKQDATDDPGVLAYTFEVKGYRFLVLDARGPDEIDPQGLLSEEQLAFVRREATPDGPPLVVFLHYPVWPLNSIWMDKNMLVVNGVDLHQALLPARDRLRAVFYGHVHQAMQTIRDGILYVATASTFAQFAAWPPHAETVFDADYPPAYSFVHLMPEQTIIHQHTFPRK
ncbi:MAG: metallophosphoesterase [Ardenticatenaceae bacterium]|nr:metallophosphoesterase [Ardenticatenaceae bacterium]MCB9445157.1 metallophosphoesterase [Ardenticatenaceae bacterium]